MDEATRQEIVERAVKFLGWRPSGRMLIYKIVEFTISEVERVRTTKEDLDKLAAMIEEMRHDRR